MRSVVWSALGLLGVLACGLALADGGYFSPIPPPGVVEQKLISEPEQKAAVLFSKGIEDLIISPSYKGDFSSFAWVVPVPSVPKVRIVNGALFHELKSLVPDNVLRQWSPRPEGMGPGEGAPPPPVQVLERKVVGSYDVAVLKSTDAAALTKWLSKNGYRLSKMDRFVATRIKPIQYYVEHKWTFVACKVKTPEKGKGLRTGTLAPLRLTFKTPRPVYPLKMTSLNPGSFSLVLYVLIPTAELPERFGGLMAAATDNKWFAECPKGLEIIPGYARLAKGQLQRPTLAKLCGKEFRVFGVTKTLSQYDCYRDIIWDPKRQPRSRRVK